MGSASGPPEWVGHWRFGLIVSHERCGETGARYISPHGLREIYRASP
jgi:hypothetical protein